MLNGNFSFNRSDTSSVFRRTARASPTAHDQTLANNDGTKHELHKTIIANNLIRPEYALVPINMTYPLILFPKNLDSTGPLALGE